MDNLDKKIEQTLNSIEGIQQAEMPDALYHKILNRVESLSPAEGRVVPLRRVLLAAAIFLGLVIANVSGVLLFNQQQNTVGGKNSTQLSAKTISSAYFNDSTYNY